MVSLASLVGPIGLVVKMDELMPVLVTTIIFVAIGLVVFLLAFLLVVMLAPFSVKKEIEEDHNTSLAIIIGAIIIGIAMIIASAIHGG